MFANHSLLQCCNTPQLYKLNQTTHFIKNKHTSNCIVWKAKHHAEFMNQVQGKYHWLWNTFASAFTFVCDVQVQAHTLMSCQQNAMQLCQLQAGNYLYCWTLISIREIPSEMILSMIPDKQIRKFFHLRTSSCWCLVPLCLFYATWNESMNPYQVGWPSTLWATHVMLPCCWKIPSMMQIRVLNLTECRQGWRTQ